MTFYSHGVQSRIGGSAVTFSECEKAAAMIKQYRELSSMINETSKFIDDPWVGFHSRNEQGETVTARISGITRDHILSVLESQQKDILSKLQLMHVHPDPLVLPESAELIRDPGYLPRAVS